MTAAPIDLDDPPRGRSTGDAEQTRGAFPWGRPGMWAVAVLLTTLWIPVHWRLAVSTRHAVRVLGINDYPLHVDIVRRFSFDPTTIEAPHFLFHAAAAVGSWILPAAVAAVLVVAASTTLTYLAVVRLMVEPSADGGGLPPATASVLGGLYLFAETPVLVLLALRIVPELTAYQTVHWWGNPTWLVALPFAIMTLPAIERVRVLAGTGSRAVVTQGRLLTLLVVLGCLAKPTLALVLVPALPVYLAVVRSPARVHLTMLGRVVLPVLAAVSVQTWFLGSGRSDSFSSGFAFDPIVEPVMGWHRMGLLFWTPLLLPLAAAVLTRGRFIREPHVLLVLICTGFAAALMLTVTETGGRAVHGNMGVPTQMCVALLVILSIRCLALHTRRQLDEVRSRRPRAVAGAAVVALLVVAFLAGGTVSYLDAVGLVDVPTEWFVPPARSPDG